MESIAEPLSDLTYALTGMLNILGTKKYLSKIKISGSDKCYLGKDESESISHLFNKCIHVQDLLHNLNQCIINVLKIHVDLNEQTTILGYVETNGKFWPVNFLLIITQYYVFNCSKNKMQINIFDFQAEIKLKLEEQSHIFRTNSSTEKFDIIWMK